MDILHVIVWAVLLVLSVVCEAVTVSLVGVWFALASFAALLLAFFGVQFWVQLLVFILVSAVSLAFFRSIVSRFFGLKHIPTNADRLFGKEAVVTAEIDNVSAVGEIKIMGQLWGARSMDGSVIPENSRVIVDHIEGVYAYVVPIVGSDGSENE